MRKLTYILITTITFLIIPSHIYAKSEQPDYNLIHDTLITALNPSIQKEIIHYYGYSKQYGLYDAKIQSLVRHDGQFSFIAKIQVTTFVHAHNPPYGKETMIFEISPSGVKTISFNHEGDKDEKEINEFYHETISDIEKSFHLNLQSYTSFTYDQLQYQAEINNEFRSLFTIGEEIVTTILPHDRKIPFKNVIDPITFVKGNRGYLLFKRSYGTNINYIVQKKDENWIIIDKRMKK